MRARYLLGAAIASAAAATVLVPRLTGRTWEGIFSDLPGAIRTLTENTVRAPQASAPAPGAAAPAAAVTVGQPLQREIVEWDETTGRFDAVEAVEIKARVSGYLTEVLFKDGQDVKKGDTLFVIDPRPYENALSQAEAELAQATTRISNASLDVERARPLVERRVVSEKTFDDRANLQREAEAAARIAEEKVKTAKFDLSFTQMTAPISGRIGRTIVTAGNYVTAGGTTGSTTLATIVSQDPIYLYFDITEADALKYKRLAAKGVGTAAKPGASVEAALPDETGFPHPGIVDFLDNRLDPGTGSLRARAVFENKDRLFQPGQFARLRLQGSPRYTAILVPDEAIGADQINRYVVVVGADDLPVRKLVKPGPLVDGLRVIREGIDANDWVVTKGLTRVRAGQKVAPTRGTVSVSQSGANGVTR